MESIHSCSAASITTGRILKNELARFYTHKRIAGAVSVKSDLSIEKMAKKE
jgi:hypothetical protein